MSELKWLNTQKIKISKTEIAIQLEPHVILTEVEARKCVLFGGLSSGISNKRKSAEWKTVTINAVGLENRAVSTTAHLCTSRALYPQNQQNSVH